MLGAATISCKNGKSITQNEDTSHNDLCTNLFHDATLQFEYGKKYKICPF
jgi:hypothetical protein